ncbi:MAG: autoinducer binding domain-containing protein [Pseudomonadota bacterium]
MSDFSQRLARFASALDSATNVESVWELGCEFARGEGFDKVSYHAVRPDADAPDHRAEYHVKTTGFPEEWLQRYLDEHLHLIDPITQRALVSTAPFQWSTVTEAPDLEPRARQFVRDLKAAGVGDGVALQAFGPNLRSAYVGLGFAEPPAEPLPRERLLGLSFAAQVAHLAVCRIDDAQVEYDTAQISLREAEVLTHMAQGYSTVRIAKALGVSRHTVDALQRRIFAKLGVSDRTSAVVYGLAAGLIQVPVVHPTTPPARTPGASRKGAAEHV